VAEVLFHPVAQYNNYLVADLKHVEHSPFYNTPTDTVIVPKSLLLPPSLQELSNFARF